jgi:pyruvate,water dikinase
MIRSLQDVLPEHLSDYGGKAIKLGRLQEIGVQVPKGIVVSTEGFNRFLDQCQHLETLKVLQQEETDIETILEIAEEFYKDASRFGIPPDLTQDISHAFDQLLGNQPASQQSYAVRSSATVEDTAQFSFAGQAESFLCVSNVSSILDAIKSIWLSLYSPRSLLYLRGKGIPLHQVRMGVIIQEMILGDISGVMFTANASTDDTNQLVIDATWGLGESIVAGKVTPDHFVLQKAPLTVIHRHLGTKDQYSAPSPRDQPNCTVLLETPSEKRGTYCITDEQLLAIARLGLRIEEHFGVPQDIEWTYHDGRFVVLQTRPITTL